MKVIACVLANLISENKLIVVMNKLCHKNVLYKLVLVVVERKACAVYQGSAPNPARL